MFNQELKRAGTHSSTALLDLPPRARAAAFGPVVYWAFVGAVLWCFELYVLARWVLGPHFVTTLPGPDLISSTQRIHYQLLQIGVSVATLMLLWVWVIAPWRRCGHLTTDGMLALSGGMIFFWDMCMNYTSVTLLYNSNFVNFGCWANGAWPGWTSPNGNLLPEPVFVAVPGYTALVFSQVVLICWALQRVKRRWPAMSVAATLSFIVVGLTGLDTVIEIFLLRSGLYAYPGGIRALSLFAGKTYQFPMTEGVLFGGLGLGAMAALKHFRSEQGQTLAERGSERLTLHPVAKQWVKFLAIFGFCHGSFIVLYMVPNQWLATHSDPFPTGYPSYMINGMCVSGQHHDQCPGPGIALPRPDYDN